MAITKITKDMAIIAALADLPNATDDLTPAQLKAKFDEGGSALKTYVNDTLIPALESIVDGSSGADKVGATPISSSPATVQGILEWLKTQIDNTSLGDIPDGSLTDAKLSDGVADIKNRFSVHQADYTLQIPYGNSTGGVANVYVVNLNPALTAYTEGVALAFKVDVENTEASTINVNGLGTQTVLTPDGTSLSEGDLKANSIYTVRYNGVNFILQGKGGVVLTGIAGVENVDLGYTFYSTDPKTKLTGTSTKKKWASGTSILGGTNRLNISGLDFTPRIVVSILTAKTNYFSVYDGNHTTLNAIVNRGINSSTTDRTTTGSGILEVNYNGFGGVSGDSCAWISFE